MSKSKSMADMEAIGPKFKIAEPHDLSPRSKWLRDYYFMGVNREWNNEYMPYTTGIKNDRVWAENDYYIVPEVYFYMGYNSYGVFGQSLNLRAPKISLPQNFWDLSIPERRMVFFEEAMVNYIPQEIIGPELLCGGRFNTQLSKCLNDLELKHYNEKVLECRMAAFEYHNHGFGNAGATGGHLIPDYATVVKKGFKFLFEKATKSYEQLSESDKKGPKGAELRAIIHATQIPKKLAQKYAEECRRLIRESKDLDSQRIEELEQMARNCERVPWEPASTFWEGVQSVWMTHMLVMAEESYPGPGTSFGRIDQYLGDLYQKDVIEEGNITKEFAKDIIGSFIFHCNTAYDAQIKVGFQGITAGFGQLMTLSGMGPNGEDLTNELTYTILECMDDWYPILEPKPNVRLHRNTPDRFLNFIIDMITRAQGAPFLINFDERSMAGLIREGIPKDIVWDYACVGCMENTMQGNDRSGTVNCNPNLVKSIFLTLYNGISINHNQDFIKFHPKEGKPKQKGPKTGNPELFNTWSEFWNAFATQLKFIIKHTVDTYNLSEQLRSDYLPTPYLSSLVRGCIEQGLDVRSGGPEIRFVTIEGVGFATLVDSLLAIKKYIYDEKKYSMAELKAALESNYSGNPEYVKMQSLFQNKAPKYGNDDPEADEMARKVMELWADECLKYKTPTNFQFRGGMLSWNYWAGEDAAFTDATPNGRLKGTFLSNAICPTNGCDQKGPTSNANSVGKALGGKTMSGEYVNYLPNGASHTITFNPSMLRDPEHKEKFKAYLRGYIENGGSALQINMIDAEMLKDAQKHPENYKHLLVRVTGYNAYFVAIGKELQDEIISREMHKI